MAIVEVTLNSYISVSCSHIRLCGCDRTCIILTGSCRSTLYGDFSSGGISKWNKENEDGQKYQIYKLHVQIQTLDGLRVNHSSMVNDPEKIGIHMIKMLAKFGSKGNMNRW